MTPSISGPIRGQYRIASNRLAPTFVRLALGQIPTYREAAPLPSEAADGLRLGKSPIAHQPMLDAHFSGPPDAAISAALSSSLSNMCAYEKTSPTAFPATAVGVLNQLPTPAAYPTWQITVYRRRPHHQTGRGIFRKEPLMKVASILLGLIGMGLFLLAPTGCSTAQPGVQDTLGPIPP
jgi:hypothetical protein